MEGGTLQNAFRLVPFNTTVSGFSRIFDLAALRWCRLVWGSIDALMDIWWTATGGRPRRGMSHRPLKISGGSVRLLGRPLPR